MYTVAVNGHVLSTGTSATDLNNYSSSATWTIPAADILSGANTITFTVTNPANDPATGAPFGNPNPAGLLYSLTINNNECVAPASVTTNPATAITLTGGTLNGTNGPTAADNTSFWWGTTSAGPFTSMADPSSEFPAGWSHDVGLGSALAGGAFNEALTGLIPGTTYYFAAWSQVGGIWYPGAVLSFNTTANTGTGEISGIKFEDWDADKSPYESKWEVKLSGWTIYLDNNNNGVLDAGDTSTTTDSHGAYKFTGLVAGTYHVHEVQQAGWVGITPVSGVYNVTLTAGGKVKNENFGNFKLGSISGMKFNDINGNHKKDANEPGLLGWTITLTGPHGYASTTVTDVNGNYSFTGLMQGTYKLSEVMKTGWKQTVHPGPVKINSDTNAIKKNFGNKLKVSGNKNNDKDDGQDVENAN